jgi:hypothetical protein
VPRIIVPSEPYYGAKFLLAPDILSRSPIKSGRRFIDLCAGRGALTFRARAMGFQFEQWFLNDINTAGWFAAVRDIGDKIEVPPRSRQEFEKQRALAAKGDLTAIALGPWLCFNGGSYKCGGSHGQSEKGGRRTPEAEEKNLRLMHEVLTKMKPEISGLDWRVCLERLKPGAGDLIVIDWPYIDCKTGAYEAENVLPIEGIDWLHKHPECHWVFCEFDQALYRHAFGPPIFQKEVQLRTVNFAKSKQERRIECVWTSDSYKAHLAKSGVNRDTSRLAKPVPADRPDTYYADLPLEKLLAEIKEGAAVITSSRLQMNAEMRKRLLPALLALRKRTYRKHPGFYETLASIGLNADTVRQWFYRSYTADEVIDLVEEKQSEPVGEEENDDSRGGNADEDAADLTQRFLMQADKIVSALLRDKITLAKRLAREYAESRKLAVKSEARRELRKAA